MFSVNSDKFLEFCSGFKWDSPLVKGRTEPLRLVCPLARYQVLKKNIYWLPTLRMPTNNRSSFWHFPLF